MRAAATACIRINVNEAHVHSMFYLIETISVLILLVGYVQDIYISGGECEVKGIIEGRNISTSWPLQNIIDIMKLCT